MHHAPAREQSIKTSKAKHYLKPDYSFEQFKDDCVVAFYGDIHFTYSGNDHRIQLPGFEEIVIVDDDDKLAPVYKSTTRDWPGERETSTQQKKPQGRSRTLPGALAAFKGIIRHPRGVGKDDPAVHP